MGSSLGQISRAGRVWHDRQAVKTPTSRRRNATLAIHGGEPVRTAPMPPRLALGDDEAADGPRGPRPITRERKVDPGYQGPFEKLYTDAFVEMMGGGYADAVATGTAALYSSRWRRSSCRRAAR